MGEDDCRRSWPDLMRIVEERVRPQRIASAKGGGTDRKKRAELWWQFSRSAKDLYESIKGLDRVLAISRVGQKAAIAFQSTDRVFAESLVVFAFSNYAPFSVLQSQAHDVWARFFSSSMKDDLRYTPSDCFETFPFPEGFVTHPIPETLSPIKGWFSLSFCLL